MPKPAQPFTLPSRPYLYLPDGWDAGWKAAKAAGPALVRYLGDSIVSGVNASDFMTTTWPAVVRAQLTAAYGTYADFYDAIYCTASGVSGSASSNPAWTKTATNNITFATNSGVNTLPAAAVNGSVAFGSTGDMLFTTPYACTAIDIVLYDAAAGTWQFNVDGGVSAGTIGISSGYAAPSVGASTWTVTSQGWSTTYKVSITGLSSAVHTVRIGGAGAANAFWLQGATAYGPNATGIGSAFYGTGGTDAMSWQSCYKAMAGAYKVSSGDTSHPTGFGFPFDGHLNFINVGINDCTVGNSFDSYRATLRRVIEGLRAVRPGCSIMLVASCNPDKEFNDCTNASFANQQEWPNFIAVMRQLAYAYNCAFANIHAKWGENPVAQGFLSNGANSGHPLDAGYADMATLIGSAL